MNVFDAFETSSYTFLQLSRGGITGNTIEAQYSASGVFKQRSQMVRGENAETKESNATLHVRSTEEFLSLNNNNLVGHGIRINDRDYEIIGQTAGTNFDSNVIEHYTLTLQESDFTGMNNASS